MTHFFLVDVDGVAACIDQSEELVEHKLDFPRQLHFLKVLLVVLPVGNRDSGD